MERWLERQGTLFIYVRAAMYVLLRGKRLLMRMSAVLEVQFLLSPLLKFKKKYYAYY